MSLIRWVTSSGFSPTRISTTPPTASLPFFSRLVRRAAEPNCTVATLRDVDRRAADAFDDDSLDVGERLNPADAADQIFRVALLQHAAADGGVRSRHGRIEFAERDAVGAQLVRDRRRSDIRSESRRRWRLRPRPARFAVGSARTNLEWPAGGPRSWPSPSTVYQKICPRAVASGARYGVTPVGKNVVGDRKPSRARACGRNRNRCCPRR